MIQCGSLQVFGCKSRDTESGENSWLFVCIRSDAENGYFERGLDGDRFEFTLNKDKIVIQKPNNNSKDSMLIQTICSFYIFNFNSIASKNSIYLPLIVLGILNVYPNINV